MDFHYDSDMGFVCKHCGIKYSEYEAGQHLIEIEELKMKGE
jgi:hypothetical protein